MKIEKTIKRAVIALLAAALLCACFALAGCNCNPSERDDDVTLENITVAKAPDKVTYVSGELFSADGMEITAAYSDGSSKTVTGWTVVGAETPLKTADTSVRIMYTEGDTSKFTLQNITVTGDATYFHAERAIYVAGPDNRNGVTLSTANIDTYISQGSDPHVVSYIGMMNLGGIITYNVTSAVEQTVKMTVCVAGRQGGDCPFNQMFDVIINGEQKEIADDVIVRNPGDIAYFYFTTVELEIGLAATNNVIVLTSATHLGGGTNFAYVRLVPVKPENKDTVSWTQLVPDEDAKLVGLAITARPDVTEYAAGAVFDPTGLRASATFDDGFVYDVPLAELSYSPSALAFGTEKVTVAYTFGGVTVTANVAVTVSEKGMTGLQVTGDFRKAYYEYEYFDPDGMAVTLEYSDGSREELTSGRFTYTSARLTRETTAVTVLHVGSELTAQIPVTVDAYAGTAVEFGALAAMGESNAETPADSSPAFEFAAAYGFCGGLNDGKAITYRIISSAAQTVRATVCVAGHETGSKKFNEMFAVQVGDVPVRIGGDVIVENPDKIAYFYFVQIDIALDLAAGENLVVFRGMSGAGTNFSGITLTPASADKTVRGPQTSPGEDAALTGITVGGTFRTEYTAGDKFSAAGMVVTATYSDGFSQEVKNYTVTPATLAPGTERVTISYEYKGVTKTAAVNVTVADIVFAGTPVRFNAVDAETNGNLEPDTVSSNPDVTVNGNVGGLNSPAAEEKYLRFDVTASKAGYALLTIAVAGNAGGDMPFGDLYFTYVNDEKLSVTDVVTWHGKEYTYFVTVTVTVNLRQGPNTVMFTNNGSAATNFAWIELTPASADAGVTGTAR